MHPASAARPCSGGSAPRKIGEDVTGMVEHAGIVEEPAPRRSE
jgi:hypothetical protein